MGDILLIVGIAVVALVFGVTSGAFFEQNKFAAGFAFLAVTSLAVAFFAFGTHLYIKEATLRSLTTAEKKVYVVLKKVPDEKGAFLVLFDTENKNERVAHLAVYPPDGYSETVLLDGRTILAVTGNQIVVGDPGKADFIPPIKN